jgi:hypothetical protein
VKSQVEYQKKRLNPQDVEVVIDVSEEVKTKLVNYFNFVDLKFKSPDSIRRSIKVDLMLHLTTLVVFLQVQMLDQDLVFPDFLKIRIYLTIV